MKRYIKVIMYSIIFLFLALFLYSKINYTQVSWELVNKTVDNRFVDVNNFDRNIEVKPLGRDSITGVIFYPKNYTDEKAYIPFMSKLSERGFNVYIVKTPLHMNLSTNKLGEEVVIRNPQITKWIITGEEEGEESAEKLNRYLNKNNYKSELLLNEDILCINEDEYYCERNYREELLINAKNLSEKLQKMR